MYVFAFVCVCVKIDCLGDHWWSWLSGCVVWVGVGIGSAPVHLQVHGCFARLWAYVCSPWRKKRTMESCTHSLCKASWNAPQDCPHSRYAVWRKEYLEEGQQQYLACVTQCLDPGPQDQAHYPITDSTKRCSKQWLTYTADVAWVVHRGAKEGDGVSADRQIL